MYYTIVAYIETLRHRVCPECGGSMTKTKHGVKCVDCGHEE